MGKCVFCGENAGIFRDRHAECDPIPKVRKFVYRTLAYEGEASDLQSWIEENTDAIEQMGPRYGIDDVGEAAVEGWCDAVFVGTLIKDMITDEEAKRLSDYVGHFEECFDFSFERMIETMPRFKRCCAIMDIAVAAKEVKRGNYCIDTMLKIDKLRTPFNLQKSEKLVLLIPDVEYDEDYYTDTGLFGITTKHLYFSGRRKKFRIRYDRLVTYEYSRDRLTVMRDALSAKPQGFITGNGRITYELVDTLNKQHIARI